MLLLLLVLLIMRSCSHIITVLVFFSEGDNTLPVIMDTGSSSDGANDVEGGVVESVLEVRFHSCAFIRLFVGKDALWLLLIVAMQICWQRESWVRSQLGVMIRTAIIRELIYQVWLEIQSCHCHLYTIKKARQVWKKDWATSNWTQDFSVMPISYSSHQQPPWFLPLCSLFLLVLMVSDSCVGLLSRKIISEMISGKPMVQLLLCSVSHKFLTYRDNPNLALLCSTASKSLLRW